MPESLTVPRPPRGLLARVLPVLVSVAIILVAGTVLWRTLGSIDLDDVAARFGDIAPDRILLAAACMAGVWLAVAAYEVAMLRHLQAGMPDWKPFLTALIAFPIGHAVGFGALSGGAVRYRFYAAAGLSAFSIGKVVILSVFPFAMGLGLLCGLAFVFRRAEAAGLLALDPLAIALLGAALLVLHAAYVVTVIRLRGPISLKWFELELPGPRLTGLQYLLGVLEVLCAAGILYALLPTEAEVAFLPFVAVYIVAILAGLLSSVPAGLGVVESMLLLTLRELEPEALLGAVLAYRLVYELVPLVTAIGLLLGWEAISRRHPPAGPGR